MNRLALTLCVGLVPFAQAQNSPDAAKIRASRLAQNRAIVAHDVERVSAFWTDDVTLRRGLGHAVDGRAAYRKLFEAPQTDSSLVYQRAPSSIEVSKQWPLAFETGTWTGRLGGPKGPVVISGKYSAQWVKRDTSWLIRSEVFVALKCAGVGCKLQHLDASP